MDMFWANLSPFLSAPCHTATDVTVDLRRELTVFTLIYCMPETAAVDSLCHMSTLYGRGAARRPADAPRASSTYIQSVQRVTVFSCSCSHFTGISENRSRHLRRQRAVLRSARLHIELAFLKSVSARRRRRRPS